jgi:hypothetical protein
MILPELKLYQSIYRPVGYADHLKRNNNPKDRFLTKLLADPVSTPSTWPNLILQKQAKVKNEAEFESAPNIEPDRQSFLM